jgi:hypothetical protein
LARLEVVSSVELAYPALRGVALRAPSNRMRPVQKEVSVPQGGFRVLVESPR